MRKPTLGILWVCLICTAVPTLAQTESELDVLRAELAQMRSDYESRIAQLEKRLDEAEKNAGEQQATTVQTEAQVTKQADPWQPEPSSGQILNSNNNASNPAIGVIFQGQVWSYNDDPDLYEIPGFPLGGEAGPLPEGLALGETEINISANVDDKFTAWLTVPIAIEDSEVVVELRRPGLKP